MDFTYIERIIASVRNLLALFPEYSETISHNANIRLNEVEGNVFLDSISIRWYDEILITQTRVLFRPEHGKEKVVMEYKSFDDLISKGEKR